MLLWRGVAHLIGAKNEQYGCHSRPGNIETNIFIGNKRKINNYQQLCKNNRERVGID